MEFNTFIWLIYRATLITINNHSELVQSITSIIMVMVTVGLVWLTYKMIKQNGEVFYLSSRPYVTILTTDRYVNSALRIVLLKFKITNQGKLPAKVKRLVVKALGEPSVDRFHNAILSPGQIIETDFSLNNDRTEKDTVVDIEIYYEPLVAFPGNKYLTKYSCTYQSEERSVKIDDSIMT